MACTLRFAYLDCEDAAKWAGHESIAEALLHPGASWMRYRCFNRELPPLESLAQLDGVLISGSHYSVYEDLQWIRELEDWLRQAVAQYPKLNFICMCFGCQVMATALGGRVGKNPVGGFVLGVEEIDLLEPLASSTALRLAAADAEENSAGAAGTGGMAGSCSQEAGPARSTVRLIQSHGDAVLELGPGCLPLATSGTAAIEMFTNKSGNVLAVQGHAELTREEVLEKIWPAITAAGRLSAEEATESQRSLQQDPTDAHLVQQLFRRFMEVGLPEAATAAAAQKGGPGGASSGTGAVASSAGETDGSVPTDTASASAAPAAVAAGAGESATAAAASAQLEGQLQRAIQAELDKGTSEQLLLQQVNQAAADRYDQQLVPAAAAARQRLEELGQQQAQLAPHAQVLDDLEAQVEQLELTLTQLDARSRRLQSQLAELG